MLSALLAVAAALSGGPSPPEAAPVVERVAVYSANVRLRRDGSVLARTRPGRLFTVSRTEDEWAEPLSSQPLPAPSIRGVRPVARLATRCGPRRKRGRWKAYTPLRLTARSDGVAITSVFAFARLSPARRLVPTGLTQQVEACGSAQVDAAEGTRIDTVAAVVTGRVRTPILIGERWGDAARDGAVSERGFVLRGRALVEGGALTGGVGPVDIPGAGLDRYASNQVYGAWDARAEVSGGPAGTVVLGLYEEPRRAPLPRFTVRVAVAYR
jgi:hypothetical protein